MQDVTLINDVAATVADRAPGRRLLVGIDGPDASGKSMFANQLAAALTVPVLRASIDGFHHRQEYRLRRGIDSPEGYYRDSFDIAALEEHLLAPFARGEDMVRTRIFDFVADAEVEQDFEEVPEASVLVFDGVFVLRPELRRWWDVSVYLHVPEEVSIERARVRDAAVFGSADEAEFRYRSRYMPGQALYRQDARPVDAAHIAIDNSDAEAPQIMKWEAVARV